LTVYCDRQDLDFDLAFEAPGVTLGDRQNPVGVGALAEAAVPGDAVVGDLDEVQSFQPA